MKTAPTPREQPASDAAPVTGASASTPATAAAAAPVPGPRTRTGSRPLAEIWADARAQMPQRAPRSEAQRGGNVVFVLSGGGSRGAAQIGMLQALVGSGIVPTHLVGTSVGALNAVAYAWQPTYERTLELEEKWAALATRDIFGGTGLTKMGHLLRRHPFLYDNDRLRRVITSWVSTDRLEKLALPVRAVTTDLGTGRPAYHDTGDLAEVLLASTALPGLFPPVQLRDPRTSSVTAHVDGGVSDNVPLAGVHGLEPTRVYVLDVTTPPSLTHARSPLDVLVASFGVSMQLRPTVDFGRRVVVHHLRSSAGPADIMDFSHTRELVRSGREAALESLATQALRETPKHLRTAQERLRAMWHPAEQPTVRPAL